MFSAVARLFADSALLTGGSDIMWHRAQFCPYVRDTGQPCYNEGRGSPWIECPVCKGEGAIYAHPRYFKGIYTDNSNQFFPDGSGGWMEGHKTLSVPRNLDIKLLKPRSGEAVNAARRLLRDKFELLGECCEPDGSRKIIETMYLEDDTVSPTVNSGTIYKIIKVVSNY